MKPLLQQSQTPAHMLHCDDAACKQRVPQFFAPKGVLSNIDIWVRGFLLITCDCDGASCLASRGKLYGQQQRPLSAVERQASLC